MSDPFISDSELTTNQASAMQVYLRLLSYVKKYWQEFSLSVLGYLLYSSSQPALAWVAGWLSEAVYNPDPHAQYLIPATLVGIYVIRGLGLFIGNYYISKVSEFVVHTLRCEMFDHQLKLTSEYYDKHNSGELISRITFNVQQVTGAATDALKVMLREGIAVIALLSTLFYLNWLLSLIFIAIAPVIAIVVRVASRKFRKISHQIQQAMGDVTHVVSESINAQREVKSFSAQQFESARFQQASQDNRTQNIKMVMTASINAPVLQLIVAIALSFLLYVGLSLASQMSPAEFITYMTAAGLLPKPIRQLSDVNSMIQKGIAAATSIFDLLDAPSEKDTGILCVKRVQGLLQVKNVSFRYDNSEKDALSNISFSVEPGQSIALVGRSGSGKSTLASLIPRFYMHTQGEILLDHYPIANYELTNLRDQVALVSQNVSLFNDTIAHNIAYGRNDVAIEEIYQAARSANALEFIEQLPQGMETIIGENGALLSGGQRQRLALARAFLKNAPIIIMDEATSALDTESERAIQQALEKIMQGRTTIIIAHRLSTIEKADKIIVLEQGKIVETGDHNSLLALQGPYYGLYQNQFEVNAS